MMTPMWARPVKSRTIRIKICPAFSVWPIFALQHFYRTDITLYLHITYFKSRFNLDQTEFSHSLLVTAFSRLWLVFSHRYGNRWQMASKYRLKVLVLKLFTRTWINPLLYHVKYRMLSFQLPANHPPGFGGYGCDPYLWGFWRVKIWWLLVKVTFRSPTAYECATYGFFYHMTLYAKRLIRLGNIGHYFLVFCAKHWVRLCGLMNLAWEVIGHGTNGSTMTGADPLSNEPSAPMLSRRRMYR